MRVLYVPPFPEKIEIADLENLIRTRLGSRVMMWSNQATSLLGYMCHPTDEAARIALIRILQGWDDRLELGEKAPVPAELGRVQADWLRVADIFHHYCDLIAGKHQERRGGPSIGKAITIVSASAKSRGTGEANLWKVWGDYKDVAHLVTSAALVCAEVRTRFRNLPPGPAGLSRHNSFLSRRRCSCPI
jgi:hypothetical protein